MFLKFCDAIAQGLRYILIGLGVVMLFSVTLQVAGRYVPFVPRWLWPLEITNWAMIWMVFIGAALGVKEVRHFNVDLFMGKTPSRPVYIALKAIYYVFVGFVTLTFIFFGYAFLVKWAMIQTSEILSLNLGYLYVSVPVTGFLWLLFLIEDFYKDFFVKSGDATGEER